MHSLAPGHDDGLPPLLSWGGQRQQQVGEEQGP